MPLKLHRPLAEQVVNALHQIFGEGYHADKVIERLFKHNRRLGARDRRFVAESTYEMVRWWKLIWSAMGEDEADPERLWAALGSWLLIKQSQDSRIEKWLPGVANKESLYEVPQWPEFQTLSERVLLKNLAQAIEIPSILYSVPEWLYQLGAEELGTETWQTYLHALNLQAPVVLRANRLKTNREALQEILAKEDIHTDWAPQTEDGLILRERKNVFTAACFKSGFFEVQDGASQAVTPLLRLEPGLRVIDACAGAGGKTLHMASLMNNKGKIIALDYGDSGTRKLDELRKRCSRAGVDIVEARLIDSAKTIKRLENSADRVLLDVPCSGLGVLRRNPDTKWKLTIDSLDQVREAQKSILESYSKMTKPGGLMVYATCSILPSENELQVKNFLEKSQPGQWKLISEHRFVPGENGYDGFYAALLEKENQ